MLGIHNICQYNSILESLYVKCYWHFTIGKIWSHICGKSLRIVSFRTLLLWTKTHNFDNCTSFPFYSRFGVPGESWFCLRFSPFFRGVFVRTWYQFSNSYTIEKVEGWRKAPHESIYANEISFRLRLSIRVLHWFAQLLSKMYILTFVQYSLARDNLSAIFQRKC